MYTHMDKTLTPQERAESLLEIMNLEEKINQLQCLLVQDIIDENGEVTKWDLIGENGLGGLAFERVIMPHSLEKEVEIINDILRKFKENTRLGIPPFIHAEALHGLCLKGTTSFPQAIGLSPASRQWQHASRAATSVEQHHVACSGRIRSYFDCRWRPHLLW